MDHFFLFFSFVIYSLAHTHTHTRYVCFNRKAFFVYFFPILQATQADTHILSLDVFFLCGRFARILFSRIHFHFSDSHSLVFAIAKKSQIPRGKRIWLNISFRSFASLPFLWKMLNFSIVNHVYVHRGSLPFFKLTLTNYI